VTSETAFQIPTFPLFDVDDAEVAFGANASRYYGSRAWDAGKVDSCAISRALRKEEKIVSALFFNGGKLSDHGREYRPDIDQAKAHRAVRALMGSWDVSHEQKTATVALAIHHWTRPLASGMEAPSGGETGTGSTEGDGPTAESGGAQ
jgi:hypothetical protein